MRIATCHCVYKSDDSGRIYLINMQDFPGIYREFCEDTTMSEDINTADVEEEGRRLLPLLKNGSDDAKHTNKEIITDINNFVRSIFKWGGKSGQRVSGKVYPKNKSEEENTKIEATVAKVVAESASLLQGENLDLDLARQKIQDSRGFGPSYSSKVVRMLLPEKAGAYDEILEKEFSSYKEYGSYSKFCGDCQKIADDLKKLDIKSHRENGEWFVADVEAVIYHYIKPIYKAKIKNAS